MMKSEKKSWMKSLFAYAAGEEKRMVLSVILSVLSVGLELVPFYCMYRLICLFAADSATAGSVIQWCLWALAAYGVKILLFSLSTGVSHSMAYTILEALRLRLADRFLHAPLGDVENHSIGEIKTMMVDKYDSRQVLKNAPIIILDEATASIDPENEHLIQHAISELTRGKTIITIAHRLATIEQADQILVVDDGQIVQSGTHEALIHQDGLYRRFMAIRQQAEGWHIAEN